MFATHPFASFTMDAAEISYVAPAVRFGIGVDQLTIEAGLGDAETIVVTHHRRCVHHKGDDVAPARIATLRRCGRGVARFSQERDEAFIATVRVDQSNPS